MPCQKSAKISMHLHLLLHPAAAAAAIQAGPPHNDQDTVLPCISIKLSITHITYLIAQSSFHAPQYMILFSNPWDQECFGFLDRTFVILSYSIMTCLFSMIFLYLVRLLLGQYFKGTDFI